MSFWVIFWGKTHFEAKNRFSAERKNARFSVIPARTVSVVLLGHFFDGPGGCLRIVDVRGIMACACACAKGRLEIRQKIYTNGFSG